MPQDQIRVRGKAGRFIPYGARCCFLGWREADDGEEPEVELPAGRGPRDTPKVAIRTQDDIVVTIPERTHGRALRLIRCEMSVESDTLIRKAISDGDLELVQGETP